MAKTKSKSTATEAVTIAPPNFKVATFGIVGTAPYVQHRFSAKAQELIRDRQTAGSTARKGTKREAKDFQALLQEARADMLRFRAKYKGLKELAGVVAAMDDVAPRVAGKAAG